MDSVDVRSFEDDHFVLHFGGSFKEIDAVTLGNSLLALQALASDINRYVNPGFEVELVVDGTAEGSFRARIKIVYKELNNLFTAHPLAAALIIGILTSYIYERTLSVSSEPIIIVHSDEVSITYDGKTIIVPRVVNEKKKEIENKADVKKSLNRLIESVQRDEKIESIAIVSSLDYRGTIVNIPRAIMSEYLEYAKNDDEDEEREVTEFAVVTVIKAVFEKSGRKWEFIWNGVRISAPIMDEDFLNELQSRRVSIKSGDTFDIYLLIKQFKSKRDGVWINKGYQVQKVIRKSDLG
jgi:hypothetical protein